MAERTQEWAYEVQRAVREAGGTPEELLRAKCRWEHMSRTAVVLTWGDPRTWPDAAESKPGA